MKGLEFDDVILYNFFSKFSESKHLWRILNDITIDQIIKMKSENAQEEEEEEKHDVENESDNPGEV